jgi:hypothetical protein
MGDFVEDSPGKFPWRVNNRRNKSASRNKCEGVPSGAQHCQVMQARAMLTVLQVALTACIRRSSCLETRCLFSERSNGHMHDNLVVVAGHVTTATDLIHVQQMAAMRHWTTWSRDHSCSSHPCTVDGCNEALNVWEAKWWIQREEGGRSVQWEGAVTGTERIHSTLIVLNVLSGPVTRHGGALGERIYSSYSLFTSALEGGEWSASRPGRALPLGIEPPVPVV